MSPAVENRPVVTDCPELHYTSPREEVRLLYRKCVGATDWVEIIGDPDNGCYEWVIRDEAGKIVEFSDSGYGSTETALRDGIAAYYHEPSVGETRDMANILPARIVTLRTGRTGAVHGRSTSPACCFTSTFPSCPQRAQTTRSQLNRGARHRRQNRFMPLQTPERESPERKHYEPNTSATRRTR